MAPEVGHYNFLYLVTGHATVSLVAALIVSHGRFSIQYQ